ncbi:MAG: hypothetical protein HS123_11185 [Solibacteraceae bacterium]|nr:hypothetical protein [Solibacteraceae bacterium]
MHAELPDNEPIRELRQQRTRIVTSGNSERDNSIGISNQIMKVLQGRTWAQFRTSRIAELEASSSGHDLAALSLKGLGDALHIELLIVDLVELYGFSEEKDRNSIPVFKGVVGQPEGIENSFRIGGRHHDPELHQGLATRSLGGNRSASLERNCHQQRHQKPVGTLVSYHQVSFVYHTCWSSPASLAGSDRQQLV